MKRTRIILLVITVVALVSVAAALGRELVGERIILLFSPPEQTFEANAPFHIYHGWGWYYMIGENPSEYASVKAPGRGYFTLTLDGEPVKFDFLDKDFEIIEYMGDRYQFFGTMWAFNFPEGLEGDHTFVGTYYFPCKEAPEQLGIPCDGDPNDVVPVYEFEVLVHFLP